MRTLALVALLAAACVGSDPQLTPDQCPVPYPAHGSYLAGSCFLSCARGWADCDGEITNGCEVTLGTDTNCGSCGDTCARRPGSSCRLQRPGLSTAMDCMRPGE